jgi:hypothetical protein
MLKIKLHNPYHGTECSLHLKEHKKGMLLKGMTTEIATPSQGQLEKIKALCTGPEDCQCLYRIAQHAQVNGVRYPVTISEKTITIYK